MVVYPVSDETFHFALLSSIFLLPHCQESLQLQFLLCMGLLPNLRQGVVFLWRFGTQHLQGKGDTSDLMYTICLLQNCPQCVVFLEHNNEMIGVVCSVEKAGNQ